MRLLRGRWTRWALLLAVAVLPLGACAEAGPLQPELSGPEASRAAATDAELSEGGAVVW